jgi:hypothetical protein
LSVVKAAKAIGVTRQQLYNVIGGKSAVTPEMALRFETPGPLTAAPGNRKSPRQRGTRAGVYKENVTMADGALLAWRQ